MRSISVKTKEIDFVAVRRDERIYVQVCRSLPEESGREVANLLKIKDHYPKYVVTLDELAAGNINGVKIVYLEEFLLSKIINVRTAFLENGFCVEIMFEKQGIKKARTF